MSLTYFLVLAVQGSLVPVLWFAYWRRVKPYLKFLAWSTPLALVLGFAWDYLMAIGHVWVWLSTYGVWAGMLPLEDLVFILEIYLLTATFTILELKRPSLSSPVRPSSP